MTDPRLAPRPTRKADRREATRRRLLDAARRLIAEKGFEETSVTEIARAAGVTHAMINVYFNGKAGLLYEILSESNQDQIDRSGAAERCEGGLIERITRLIETWIEGDLADPRLAAVMLAYSWQWPAATEAANRAQRDRGLETARRIVRRGVAEGELRPDVDVEDLVQVIYAIYLSGLRPAVIDGDALAACVERIRRRIALVLRGAG